MLFIQSWFPRVKHTPANGNYPSQDMGFKVHNGEDSYFHPDLCFPHFLGALTSPGTTLSANKGWKAKIFCIVCRTSFVYKSQNKNDLINIYVF